MEVLTRKRLRSDDSSHSMQSKIRVNEKIFNCSSSSAMEQIHKKTKELLFSAAKTKEHCAKTTNALQWQMQVLLAGNGAVDKRQISAVEKPTDKSYHLAVCCMRQVLIEGDCINCQTKLCEYCGFSCTECFMFLCNRCVTLFGCGTTERPMCNNCALFD